jgi:hypothetical protein
MWPGPNTIYFLVFSLAPIVYVIFLALKNGYPEVSSLRFSGIVFIWIGYQFSPWLSYFTGEFWDNYLLVPDYIDVAILFSGIAMYIFLIGYAAIFNKKFTKIRGAQNLAIFLPIVRQDVLVYMTFLVLAVTIISVGGFDEFWLSSFSRGHGQFEVRNFQGAVMQMILVIRLPLQLVLVLMASISMIGPRKSSKKMALGCFALLISSLGSIWEFSRVAGFGLFIFAFLLIKYEGRRRIFSATFVVALAIFLGSVGLNERGKYNPGISNFASAIFTSEDNSAQSITSSAPSIQNPLDATAPFTRKAEMREIEAPDALNMGMKFLWNLNPLPSELFPIHELGTGSCRGDGYCWLYGIDNACLR